MTVRQPAILGSYTQWDQLIQIRLVVLPKIAAGHRASEALKDCVVQVHESLACNMPPLYRQIESGSIWVRRAPKHCQSDHIRFFGLILGFCPAMLSLYGTETQKDPSWGGGREGYGLGQPGLYRLGDRATCTRIEPCSMVSILAGHPVHGWRLLHRLLPYERGKIMLTLTFTILGGLIVLAGFGYFIKRQTR